MSCQAWMNKQTVCGCSKKGGTIKEYEFMTHWGSTSLINRLWFIYPGLTLTSFNIHAYDTKGPCPFTGQGSGPGRFFFRTDWHQTVSPLMQWRRRSHSLRWIQNSHGIPMKLVGNIQKCKLSSHICEFSELAWQPSRAGLPFISFSLPWGIQWGRQSRSVWKGRVARGDGQLMTAWGCLNKPPSKSG